MKRFGFALAAAAGLLISSADAAVIGYSVQSITPVTSNNLPQFFLRDLNNKGDILFVRPTNGPNELVLRSNGTEAVLPLGSASQLDEAGNAYLVQFVSNFPPTPSRFSLLKANGATSVELASSDGPINRIAFSNQISVSQSGNIAFDALLDAQSGLPSARSINTVINGVLSEIDVSVGSVVSLERPQINDLGELAYFRLGAIVDPSQIANPIELVHSAGGVESIIDSSDGVNNSISRSFLSINNAGQILYEKFDANQNAALYLYSSGAKSVIADTNGAFSNFNVASLNSAGDIAFTASLDDSRSSLNILSGGLLKTILTTGDTLAGRVVSFIAFSGLFNDHGQIAATISFTDQTTGNFLFSPNGVNEVPIPGAIALFATGLAGLALRRRKKVEAACA